MCLKNQKLAEKSLLKKNIHITVVHFLDKYALKWTFFQLALTFTPYLHFEAEWSKENIANAIRNNYIILIETELSRTFGIQRFRYYSTIYFTLFYKHSNIAIFFQNWAKICQLYHHLSIMCKICTLWRKCLFFQICENK